MRSDIVSASRSAAFFACGVRLRDPSRRASCLISGIRTLNTGKKSNKQPRNSNGRVELQLKLRRLRVVSKSWEEERRLKNAWWLNMWSYIRRLYGYRTSRYRYAVKERWEKVRAHGPWDAPCEASAIRACGGLEATYIPYEIAFHCHSSSVPCNALRLNIGVGLVGIRLKVLEAGIFARLNSR